MRIMKMLTDPSRSETDLLKDMWRGITIKMNAKQINQRQSHIIKNEEKGEKRGIYSTNLKKSICTLLNLVHNAKDCKEPNRYPDYSVERCDFYGMKLFYVEFVP